MVPRCRAEYPAFTRQHALGHTDQESYLPRKVCGERRSVRVEGFVRYPHEKHRRCRGMKGKSTLENVLMYRNHDMSIYRTISNTSQRAGGAASTFEIGRQMTYVPGMFRHNLLECHRGAIVKSTRPSTPGPVVLRILRAVSAWPRAIVEAVS